MTIRMAKSSDVKVIYDLVCDMENTKNWIMKNSTGL